MGTQACRVAAVNWQGTLLAASQRPLRSARTPDGRHEQDPAQWIEAVAGACRVVVDRLAGRPVAGLSICSTSGTFVVVDHRGRPITPGLMYNDMRASADLPAVVDAWAECAQRNGYRIQPSWALPRLVWVMRQVAGAETGQLRHCADHVGAFLAGHPLPADASHALKTGYDLVNGVWPKDAFEAVGIPAQMLPNVVAPGTIVGAVGRAAATATGLSRGTPIVAGMTDGCASQVASGAVAHGEWNSALGTTLVLKGSSARLLRDPAGAVYSHVNPDGGWLPGGASNCGAGTLDAAFPDADPAEMDRAAAAYAPTPVLRYPLPAPGERFPFVRPDAEPFQVGTPASDAELFAALQQGVAFVERLSLDHMRSLGAQVVGPIAVTGGATRSGHWNQLRADVLGRPLRLPQYPDAAVGMAVLAAAGATGVHAGESSYTKADSRESLHDKPTDATGPLAAAARAMVTTARLVEPRPAATARYLPIYARMVDALSERGYIDSALAAQARRP